MSSNAINIACAIVPLLFPLVQKKGTKAINAVRQEVIESTPELQPPPSPAADKKKKCVSVITMLIMAAFLIVTVLTMIGRTSFMQWSCITADDDSRYNLQVIGLCLIFLALLFYTWVKEATLTRYNYLKLHYSLPPQQRQNRSIEQDLAVLRTGPFFLVRDPEQLAMHWFGGSVVLMSQSWLNLGMFGLVFLLVHLALVQRDVEWRRYFGKDTYQQYALFRGGQWFCCCCNPVEFALADRMEEKIAGDMKEFNSSTGNGSSNGSSNGNTDSHAIQINHISTNSFDANA